MARVGGASPRHGGVCPRGEKVLTIGTTAEKSFEIPCDGPCPALEAALHAQLIFWYIAVPFGCPFSFACADHMHFPVVGKAPSVLLGAPSCSPWGPQGAVPAWWCGARAGVRRPVTLARPTGCRVRRVPCCAVLCGSSGVCVGASVQLPGFRVAWLVLVLGLLLLIPCSQLTQGTRSLVIKPASNDNDSAIDLHGKSQTYKTLSRIDDTLPITLS